jgi:glycosyltransferase involved in cell wall biosynthesis
MQLAKEKLPLVSIGIPTYNGGDRIAKALDSIQQQGYSKIEILISDNASADNTEEVVRGYMARDSRIRYFRQEENLGVVPNFEFILQKASGKYFFWISDDDELIPGVLERYVEFLESHPSYSLVSGKINYWKDGVLSGWEAKPEF